MLGQMDTPDPLNSEGPDPAFTDATVAGVALPPETSAGASDAGDAALSDHVIGLSGWSYIGAWVRCGDRNSLGGEGEGAKIDREMLIYLYIIHSDEVWLPRREKKREYKTLYSTSFSNTKREQSQSSSQRYLLEAVQLTHAK